MTDYWITNNNNNDQHSVCEWNFVYLNSHENFIQKVSSQNVKYFNKKAHLHVTHFLTREMQITLVKINYISGSQTFGLQVPVKFSSYCPGQKFL